MTKQTYILIILIFVLSTGGYMAMPLFPILTDIHPINLVQAGTLTAAYIFTQKTAPVILGPLADIYGYRRFAIIGELIRGIGFIGIGFVSNYLFLFIFSLLAGLGGGFASPSLQSLVMKSSTYEERTKVSSLRASATNAGLLIGPILAGIVIWTGYIPFVFIFAGILYLIGACLLILLIDSPIRESRVKRLPMYHVIEILNNKSFICLLIFTLMFYILYAQLFITLPEYAKQFTDQIQTLFLVNGVTGLLLQFPAGLLISKINKFRSFLILGIVLIFLSFFTLTLWKDFIVLYIAILLFTIGQTILLPIIETSIAHHSDQSGNMGLYFGVSNLSDGIGRPLGSMLGGWLLYSLQPTLVWFIFSLLTFATLLYCLLFIKDPR